MSHPDLENLHVLRHPLRHLVAAPAAVVSLIVSASCVLGGLAAPVIRIGVDLPLTGAEAKAALPALNGMRYYVQRHPTLEGFAVSLVPSDDSTAGIPDAGRGAANLRAFVQDPDVLAVIGPLDSNVAREEIPVANRAMLAVVSPVTSSPCLTQDTYLPAALSPTRVAVSCQDAGLPAASRLRPTGVNNYFRLAPTDQLQGPAAADYMFKTLQVVRAAVVSDHETYGQALADSFSTRFTRLGGSVVGRLDLDPSADPAAFLNRMKADGVQGVYYGGVTTNRGCVIRAQMLDAFGTAVAAPFMGGDGIAEDPDCVRDAGADFAGMYATVPVTGTAGLASASAVVDGFRQAFPNRDDYGAYTLVSYDATAVVYAALDRAIKLWGGRLPPRRAVTAQLAGLQGVAGVTGTLGFDANGDTTHRVVSIVESPRLDRNAPWTDAGSVDYSARLPY